MLCNKERTREIWVEIFRELKLLEKEELKLVFFWLMMDFAALFGILFALIVFHQPLLRDLYNCDMRDRDPFNLQDGWLLWAIIGVIFAITAKFGTTFATKYLSKRWPQPKFKLRQKHLTKDSIDTGHGELDQLIGSPKRRILMWSVMVALLLPPVVEEYVYGGYLMASLTKWLATTIVVVISSFIISSVHWNLEQPVSHLFVGGDHSVEGSCSCSRLRRSAIGLRRSAIGFAFAGIRIMEINGSRIVFQKRKEGTKDDLNGKKKGTNDAIQA